MSKRAAKSKSGEECFNYGKKGHYAKDCHSPLSISNKKKSEESTEEAKHSRYMRNQVKTTRSTSEYDHDDSNPKLYPAN